MEQALKDRSYETDETLDSEAAEETSPLHSLTDDVMALFEDGKTYVQAEVAYQKSRGGYVANRLKGAALFGAGAFAFLHLALIALTVGLVIALAQVVGPWIATAIVVVVMLVIGIVLALAVKSKVEDMRQAFAEETK